MTSLEQPVVSPSTEDPRAVWIFGDNILECERALSLIATSLGGDASGVRWTASALYAPRYEVVVESRIALSAQLFAGYGRWGYDVQRDLRQRGAPVREATDAVILDARTRDIMLAFEFCGALPAGNNAWQRCGRALACSRAGVPYLYYAELGGLELDEQRRPKAPRFPNPIVPFAYLSLSQLSECLSAPVFAPSPSISPDVRRDFASSLGEDDAIQVIRAIMLGNQELETSAVASLQQRGEDAVRTLATRRRRADTLNAGEWDALAKEDSGSARVDWLLRRGLAWKKTTSIGTDSFRELRSGAADVGVVAAGATDVPVSLLAGERRPRFAQMLRSLYGSRVDSPFLEWIEERAARHLVLIWLAGFKPRGDDSRPDRGLLPLAQMLLGHGGDYLAILYGPASTNTWDRFQRDMVGLARDNGLWEAVVGLSDAVLVDSPTAGGLRSIGLLTPDLPVEGGAKEEPFDTNRPPTFGEHDVDTVLHTLFASAPESGVYEGMCNPPGGDWSGISFQSAVGESVSRWTSLPRVTKPGSKRPDHVVVIQGSRPVVLSIESKDGAGTVEPGIGPRLNAYVEGLLEQAPTITRFAEGVAWTAFTGAWSARADHLSGAAFRYMPNTDLRAVQAHSAVDIVFAVEFLESGACNLHVLGNSQANPVLRRLVELAGKFDGWLEVHEQ